MSLSQKSENISTKIKNLSIPEVGPVIVVGLETASVSNSNHKPPSKKGGIALEVIKPPPNHSSSDESMVNCLGSSIRLDWTYDLQSGTNDYDDPIYDLQFFGPCQQDLEFSTHYLSRCATQILKAYPYDKWGIFSVQPQGDINQREFERTFSVDKFGLTFISHAHTDHAPVNFSNAKDPEENYNNISPLPVYCTPFTQEFIQNYFKTKLNLHFNFYQSLWETKLNARYDKDPQNPIPDEKWTQISQEWRNWQRYLCAFHNYYQTTQPDALQPQIDRMQYFVPHYFHDAVCWMIPTGHVFGSAGFCISPLTQPILTRPPNSKMLTADTVFLNEFNPNLRQHLLSPPPLNARRVILDGLFADPNLEFPNQPQEIVRFLNWLEEQLRHNPVILFSWDLGKPQLLAQLLGSCASAVNSTANPEVASGHKSSIQLPEDFALVVGAETKRKFELCAQYGLPLPKILSRQEARTLKYPQTKNYLLLLNPSERGASTTQSLIAKRNAKVVEMSGWCYDPQFRADHKADAYFTISDHATYPELLAYLQSGQVDEVEIIHSESPTLRHELAHEGYRVISHPKILQGLRGIY